MRECSQRVSVGIIGCGTISSVYCKNIRRFPFLKLVGCADAVHERAQERAAEFEIPRVYSSGELLDDPEIELVVNLTIPDAHAEVSLAALERGKSVYSEKPLATKREDGRQLLEAAREHGGLLGCAPDTFLGAGLQTCRKLLDDGWIGEPVAASASLQSHGPEHWHPDPFFLYQQGAGPLFDMGPYYLTTLVSMLGPVQRIAGFTKKAFAQRVVTSPQAPYQTVPVNTPTHVAGLLEFVGGVQATFISSFDVWGSKQPPLEIHGTLGSLCLPDPNTFGGPIWLLRAGEHEWNQIPLVYDPAVNDRGLGVADLALALRQGRRQRADGAMAYHVLDIMQSFDESFQQRSYLEIESTCERPVPLALNRREIQRVFDI